VTRYRKPLSSCLARQTFRGDSGLLTWIQRILINQGISKLRTQGCLAKVSMGELLLSYSEEGDRIASAFSWSESVNAVVGRECLCLLLEKYIAELPLAYRSILMLRC